MRGGVSDYGPDWEGLSEWWLFVWVYRFFSWSYQYQYILHFGSGNVVQSLWICWLWSPLKCVHGSVSKISTKSLLYLHLYLHICVCICIMSELYLCLYLQLNLYLYLQVWSQNFNQLSSSNTDDSCRLWRAIKCQQGKVLSFFSL